MSLLWNVTFEKKMIKSAWRRFRDISTFLWKARRIEHKIFSQDILFLEFFWYVFRKQNVVFDGMSNEIQDFPGGLVVKNQPAIAGDERDSGSIPESGRFPVEGNEPILVFLPGKFHGQSNLVGYCPRGGKESDMTEHTHQWDSKPSICFYESFMSPTSCPVPDTLETFVEWTLVGLNNGLRDSNFINKILNTQPSWIEQ